MHELAQIKQYFGFDGIALDDDGLLRPSPPDPSDEPPLMLVVQHTAGYSMWLHYDLPATLIAELRVLPSEQAFHEHDRVLQIIAPHMPCETVWQGIGYTFPHALDATDYPDVVRLNEAHRSLLDEYAPGMIVDQHAVFGIIRDGRLVATCESTRENKLGGEAWVQTLPEYRGRGYARQTTAAWAHHLQSQGKRPYYNHKRSNTASQALARSLDLNQFMADVSYR